MSGSTGPSPARSGLSLYANLLDPSSSTGDEAPGTISRAPVVFNRQPTAEEAQQQIEDAKKQALAAALRFQPTKRPQINAQKPRPKQAVPKPPSAPLNGQADAPSQPAPVVPKTTLADWTAEDDDVNGFYAGQQQQRRKKRKKNKQEELVAQDWDDIYDPSRPNNYEEYKNSEERYREIREWKDRLYAHRFARQGSSDISSDEDRARAPRKAFAPPSAYSFAPPSMDAMDTRPDSNTPADVPVDATGDDAYARRLRMSQQQQPPVPPSSPPVTTAPPPPPPPEPSSDAPPPPPPPAAQPQAPGAIISRGAVRYNLPPPPADIPSTEAELADAIDAEEEAEQEGTPGEDEPRSRRPGQKGFAERLMSKYGWTKGSGLGASGTGIVNALSVKVDKKKKITDEEGKTKSIGGHGKIVGGKKKAGQEEGGKFGAMSEVIVLVGMVDGLDVRREMAEGELVQEIGEECGEKYGRVERVFVDVEKEGVESVPIYVKFTSQLSALRAVNALEGRIFNGNTIRAKFFDTEMFEREVLG